MLVLHYLFFLLYFYGFHSLVTAMPKHAKSNYEKSQHRHIAKEALVAEAVRQYRNLPPGSRKNGEGYRSVSQCVMDDHEANTGHRIKLSFTTVRRRDEGGNSLLGKAANEAALTPEEDALLTRFLQESADRGFPCNNKRIKEAALAIIQVRDGSVTYLSDSWVSRFLSRKRARKELAKYWSKSLKSVRGGAVNENTHKGYFELLAKIHAQHQFEEDCIWGGDESAFMKGVAEKEHIVGGHGKKVQHQIRQVDRENTTVICTICADGTSIPPLVIFKGSHFLIKWLEQNNPLKASLGYQKKGWTDGVLGLEWAKDFDRKTKQKARGRPQLLLVDGHSSHYTYEFLSYCAENNIVVVCYPSNSTHVYQGLDVACFGAMKSAWANECMKWETETGGGVSKETFLEVFSKAYHRAFIPDTIKSAFRKTGAWPVNPSVITAQQMAPSISMSTSSSLARTAPVPPTTPVRNLLARIESIDPSTALLRRQAPPTPDPFCDPDAYTPFCSPNPSLIPRSLDPVCPYTPSLRRQYIPAIDPELQGRDLDMVSAIRNSGNGFLLSSLPIHSSSVVQTPPRLLALKAAPSPHARTLLAAQPQTEREVVLQQSLLAAIEREQHAAETLDRERTRAALNLVHLGKLQKQANFKEKKANKSNDANLIITGDAVCLTDESMIAAAKEHRDKKAASKVDKARKAAKKATIAVQRKAWEVLDKARIARNKLKREEHKELVKVYSAEKQRCRLTKEPNLLPPPGKFSCKKAAPKPWLKGPEVDGGDGDGGDDAEEAADVEEEDNDEQGMLSDWVPTGVSSAAYIRNSTLQLKIFTASHC